MSLIQKVQVVPLPDGYLLEVTVQEDEGDAEYNFFFADAQQMANFSVDARRVALLSTSHEEVKVLPEAIQKDDYFLDIGLKVESVNPWNVGEESTYHIKSDGQGSVVLESGREVSVLRRIQ
jgi:hypothetical protein